jgi:acetoin utilization protein AcuB
MTPTPHVIAPHETLVQARQLMEDYGVRHLPVTDDGRLVGILSDRDINLVQSLAPLVLESINVEDAMNSPPYSVPIDAPLQEVARTMAVHKFGCAIVVDHGAVVGVFTTIDALHALADSLEGKHVRKTYDAVATAAPAGRRSREHDVR